MGERQPFPPSANENLFFGNVNPRVSFTMRVFLRLMMIPRSSQKRFRFSARVPKASACQARCNSYRPCSARSPRCRKGQHQMVTGRRRGDR